LSHCNECDAHPGECSHRGPRYLHPIAYEPIANEDGERIGWRVPEHERERWDNPPKSPPSRRVDIETLSLDALTDRLDPLFPDPPLLARLAAAYAVDPVRVSGLTTRILGQPNLRNPSGVLWVQLGSIVDGET